MIDTLDKLEKSEFIPVSQNERDDKTVEKSHENDNDDYSALTFKDFCMYEKFVEFVNQFIYSKMFLGTPHAKKAFLITIPSLFLSLFTGVLVIPSFATFIFNETGSSLSENDSTILVSIITLAANLVTLNIIERFNRRTLYILSSICTTISYFLFAIYGIFLKGQPGLEWTNWMPLFCFASIVFFSWLGLIPIPYIINLEISPKRIRQTCIAIVISIIWTVGFVYGLIFYTFVEVYGLYTCMIILGIFSLLTALFAIFKVPETKNLSYAEIRDLITKQ